MNTPIQSTQSKVAKSTAPTLGSTVSFGDPRAEARDAMTKAIGVSKAMDRTDRTYKSLKKAGKTWGSGFGG